MRIRFKYFFLTKFFSEIEHHICHIFSHICIQITAIAQTPPVKLKINHMID